jgi:hypothetical protein
LLISFVFNAKHKKTRRAYPPKPNLSNESDLPEYFGGSVNDRPPMLDDTIQPGSIFPQGTIPALDDALKALSRDIYMTRSLADLAEQLRFTDGSGLSLN